MRRNRKLIGRRQLLAGFGVSAAALPFLPYLESAAEGASGVGRRFVSTFTPHGIWHPTWLPSGDAEAFSLAGTTLGALDAVQSHLVVIDGMSVQHEAYSPHQIGSSCVLTGSPMLPGTLFTHPDWPAHGWNSSHSIDQEIAKHIGQETLYRSLEFGAQTDATNQPGSRISFAGPEQPLAPESDPTVMFERIFSGGVPTDPAVIKRKQDRHSVIDTVKPQLDRVLGQVSKFDRQKIEAHLDAVHDIEQALDHELDCVPPEAPAALDVGDTNVLGTIVRQQMDLMVAALACGVTNVASFMLRSGDLDYLPYSHIGVDAARHTLSHTNLVADASALAAMTTIEAWQFGEIAYLAQKMQSIVEPDGGTMLDNSLIFWFSEVAEGYSHSFDGYPFLLIGKAGGKIATNRYLRFDGVDHIRLLIAMAQAVGAPVESFGAWDTGAGALTEIFA